MNNEGLIGWMSGGEVAIIASSIQWRVKSAFITYRCPLCQQMLSRIRSHHVCLIATDSSWCTYLTNSLPAKRPRTTGSALHSCNAPPSEIKRLCHVLAFSSATFGHALLVRGEVEGFVGGSGCTDTKQVFCAKVAKTLR